MEEYEHYEANYNKFLQAERSSDFAEALSCVAYLSNKLPESRELKMFRVEALAKTGATE